MILTEPNNELNCLAFNREGDLLTTAGRDHSIRLYNTTTMQVGHSKKVFHRNFICCESDGISERWKRENERRGRESE